MMDKGVSGIAWNELSFYVSQLLIAFDASTKDKVCSELIA